MVNPTKPTDRPQSSNPTGGRSFSEHDIIFEYFRRHPRKGVMLDVGAMFGSSFRAFVDLGWEIYAFEPDPQKDLRAEFADHPDVHVLDYAISNKAVPGAPFYVSHESQGVSTLSPFLESHHEIARVEVRTLTQVIQSEEIHQIDYLKVDTEGVDLKVLQGFPWGRAGLRFNKAKRWPEVILCELDDRKSQKQGFDYHDLGGFLRDLGYEVFLSEWKPIVEYGRPHTWVSIRKYPCAVTDPHAWGNFIAVSPKGHPLTIRDVILNAVLSDRTKLREALDHRDVALVNLEKLKAAMVKRVKELHDLKRAVKRRDESISQLKESLAAKNDGLARLTDALADRNVNILNLRESLAKRDATIEDLKEKLRMTGGTIK